MANAQANGYSAWEAARSVFPATLVHELQRERGASATFVGSKGQTLGDVMRNQRVVTDKAIAEWHHRLGDIDISTLGPGFDRAFDQVKPAIADLSNVRRDIDALSIAGPKAVSYFSSTIATLTSLIEVTGELSDDSRINRRSRASAGTSNTKVSEASSAM